MHLASQQGGCQGILLCQGTCRKHRHAYSNTRLHKGSHAGWLQETHQANTATHVSTGAAMHGGCRKHIMPAQQHTSSQGQPCRVAAGNTPPPAGCARPASPGHSLKRRLVISVHPESLSSESIMLALFLTERKGFTATRANSGISLKHSTI